MVSFRACVFDLDGTLVDTVEDIAFSMNSVLALHDKKEKSTDFYRSKVGRGVDNLISECFSESSLSYREAVLHEFNRQYANNILRKTSAYPGVYDLLRKIQLHSIPVGVLTNKSENFAQRILEGVFPYIDFYRVVGLLGDGLKKPDVKFSQRIISDLCVQPSEVLYVGDTVVDMNTASNAGMVSVGVAWGYGDFDEVKEVGANYFVSQPNDIAEILCVDSKSNNAIKR